jgi:hypothetical protein
MAARRKTESQELEPHHRRPPATTPDGRERQLIAAAVDLAERQLLDGTASAQVVTHYLKLASTRERLEQRRLEMEVQLVEAKIGQIKSAARIEELYTQAIQAMRRYGGELSTEDTDDHYPGGRVVDGHWSED